MHENLLPDPASVHAHARPIPPGRYLPRQHGEEFVVTMYRVFRGAAFYSPGNPAFINLIGELCLLVNAALADTERLEVKIVRDACFCNGAIVRGKAEAFASYKGFVQWMRAHALGALAMTGRVTEEELGAFIALISSLPEGDGENARHLTAQLQERGVSTIAALALDEGPHGFDDSPQAMQRKAKQVYFSGIRVAHELLEDAMHNALDLRKAKRLIFNAVDLIMKDESTLLGLTTIKSYDDYTFNHSINVAIYAIALGNRLQLTPKYLSHLGIAGLFHDLGKTVIAREVLDKPGALSPEEWAIIRGHPRSGAEMILRMKGWGQLSSRMIAACFEHHMKYNLTGYPAVTRQQLPTLFSRIITIADCYDALSTPRVYRKVPFPSEKILALMLEESGTQFDPLLVKLLINMMGVYPLGALVLLDTNEIGIVTKIPPDPDLITRPHVCLLGYGAGQYHRDATVDLTDTDPATGAYLRSIVKTLDPKDYHINLEELAI